MRSIWRAAVLVAVLCAPWLTSAGDPAHTAAVLSSSPPAVSGDPARIAAAPGAPLFTQGLRPLELGDAPPARWTARSCRSCHSEAFQEWEASRHSVAWSNGIFQREFRSQPRQWCINCHAPLAGEIPEGSSSVDPVAAEGINCATCHVRGDRIVAASRRPGSPHETEVRSDFGDAAFCGGCHEFNFPVFRADGRLERYSAHPMQATVTQFRAGPYAGEPGACLSCHATSPAGHRFPGAHDPTMLERAVTMEVCRVDRKTVRMTVTNVGAGHAVPTGDVHRHMVARAWRSTAPTQLFEGIMQRSFVPDADGGKQLKSDTTLPPRGRQVYDVPLASLGGSPDEPINVELRYIYTADEFPRPANDPGEATWRTLVARRLDPGVLPRCDEKGTTR